MPNDIANNMADTIHQLEKELKELREENKVLTSECDRLIKEKGKLLNEVSGGDVLRICQLEEQLKGWKEEYANLNKISYGFYEELREAKRLLKLAVEDFNKSLGAMYTCPYCKYVERKREVCASRKEQYCGDICEWRYADEALKLIES